MPQAVEKRLAREIEAAGKRQGWWDSSGVLVALSGGGDSMALLCLLRVSYVGRVEAAHLNHGLRGAAADADARFVKDFCLASGIPCHARYADVNLLRLKGESAETAGRRVRYEFLEEVRAREGLSFIATAHNSDDVAETVAHHFFRGSGIDGMSGISERRGRIVRPVINCSRGELRQFLKESGVPWREDETNSENRYTRNKIRNELMPWTRANLNESTERSLLGLAGECSRLSSRLLAEAETMLGLVSRPCPPALAVWDAPTARRMSETQLPAVLRLQAERLSLPVISRKRTDALCGMIRSGLRGRFQWSGSIEVCCGGNLLGWIKRWLLEPPCAEEIFLEDGSRRTVIWGPWVINLEMTRRSEDAPGFRGGSSWCVLPSDESSGIIEISSADGFMNKNISGFHVKMPWWRAASTPVISLKKGDFFKSWLHGMRQHVCGEGVYVIIASVCARK